MTLRPSTKASRIGTVSEIGPGVYFKNSGRWFRALDAAEKPDPDHAHYGAWLVLCLAADGYRRSQYLPGSEVELMTEGMVPGPFQPNTLRRKANRMDGRATMLRSEAEQLRTLADITTGRLPLPESKAARRATPTPST